MKLGRIIARTYSNSIIFAIVWFDFSLGFIDYVCFTPWSIYFHACITWAFLFVATDKYMYLFCWSLVNKMSWRIILMKMKMYFCSVSPHLKYAYKYIYISIFRNRGILTDTEFIAVSTSTNVCSVWNCLVYFIITSAEHLKRKTGIVNTDCKPRCQGCKTKITPVGC